MNICHVCKEKTEDCLYECVEDKAICTDCIIEKKHKDMKKKLWKVLEKYGVWQDYKHRFVSKKYRDALFVDMLNIIK